MAGRVRDTSAIQRTSRQRRRNIPDKATIKDSTKIAAKSSAIPPIGHARLVSAAERQREKEAESEASGAPTIEGETTAQNGENDDETRCCGVHRRISISSGFRLVGLGASAVAFCLIPWRSRSVPSHQREPVTPSFCLSRVYARNQSLDRSPPPSFSCILIPRLLYASPPSTRAHFHIPCPHCRVSTSPSSPSSLFFFLSLTGCCAPHINDSSAHFSYET